MPVARFSGLVVGICALVTALASSSALAIDVSIPIVMPITGFMSVEGGAQRNGASMALERAPANVKINSEIYDTGTSATGAAAALDKALGARPAIAAATSVLPMWPLTKTMPRPCFSASSKCSARCPRHFRSGVRQALECSRRSWHARGSADQKTS